MPGLNIMVTTLPHCMPYPCLLPIWQQNPAYTGALYNLSVVITSFKSIGEFKLELQYWNAQFRWKLANFLSCGVLKFGGWLWKTTGILFYTVSSVVHNFKSIGEYMSYSVETRVTTSIFCPLWPWNLMDDLEKIGHLFYITLSFVHHSKPRVDSNKIYSSETKRPIWVKIGDFSPVTLKFDGWPWK